MASATTPLAVARACLQAYVRKDRAAIEALLADDFHFTSPMDNALDRQTYFAICWPNSEVLAHITRRQTRLDRGLLRMGAATSGTSQ